MGRRRGAAVVRDFWGRLCSADPGLSQLALASRATISTTVGMAVGYLASLVTDVPAIDPMLLCAVLALNISFSLADPTIAAKAVTIGLMPVPAGLAMGLAALLSPHRVPALIGFVAVMFVAVYIRRFGPRYFGYGMVAWMGYFVIMFTGVSVAQLPGLFGSVCLVTVGMLVLHLLIFRDQQDKVLAHMLHAFHVRVGAVADTCFDLLFAVRPGTAADRRLGARLRLRLVRVNEAALLVDGQLAVPNSVPEGRAEEAVRHHLLAAELAIGTIAEASGQLHQHRVIDPSAGLPRQALADVSRSLAALRRGDLATAADAADELAALGAHRGGDYAAMAAAHRLAVGITEVVDALTSLRSDPGQLARVEVEAEPTLFQPSVTLFNGRLPGAAAIVDQLPGPRSYTLRGLVARMRSTTRQAWQVALATSLAIILGSLLSEQRYYWAVLASFLAFTGTATSAEAVNKAVERALGTLVGLGVAILFVALTHGNVIGVLVVTCASVFVGFFLMRFAYALLVVFITTLVAQLYAVLHEFSSGLLLLRLTETSLGALIGCVVAVTFLPTSTRRTVELAKGKFFTAFGALLTDAGNRLRSNYSGPGLPASARIVDAGLQQLLTVARPWVLPSLFGSDLSVLGSGRQHHRLAMYTMLADQARGLARALHRSWSLRPDVGASLAEVCAMLAARVPARGGQDTWRAESSAGAAPEQTSQLLDAVGLVLADRSGVSQERQLVAYLRHIDETLTLLESATDSGPLGRLAESRKSETAYLAGTPGDLSPGRGAAAEPARAPRSLAVEYPHGQRDSQRTGSCAPPCTNSECG